MQRNREPVDGMTRRGTPETFDGDRNAKEKDWGEKERKYIIQSKWGTET